MSTPGDGFEYGEDQVTARLSIEVPPEAIRSLDDVAQRTEDLRVNMEAVAKATADYGDYLTNIPALGNDSMSRQGDFVSRNVNRLAEYEPAGLPDWQKSAGESQLSDLAQRDPRQFANVMAQRGNDLEWDDQSYVIDRGMGPLPAPRSRRESGGAGSGPSNRDDSDRPGGRDDSRSVDWMEILRSNQEQTTSTVTRVLGELALGGRSNALQTVSGLAGEAVPGLTALQQRMDSQTQLIDAENQQMIQEYAESNGVDLATAANVLQGAGALRGSGVSSLLSGLSGTLVKGAGIAGVAAGGFAAFQAAGNQYQDFRNQGLQRGGGVAEGMAFEMGVRSLAMNPFIDVDQSRRIMQTALNEGYTGKEMETVTQFMTENLIQMNLTAQESAKVLQENVIRGGQSMVEAQQDAMAATLMGQNEDARRTSEEFREGWQASTATAIAAGVEGTDASQLGLLATNMFAEDSILSDLSGQIVEGMVSNPTMGMTLAQESGYRGSPGGALEYILGQSGGDKRAMMAWARKIEEIARRLAEGFADPHRKHAAVRQFMSMVEASTGLKLTDVAQAEQLAAMAIRGDLTKEVERSMSERDRTLSGGEVEKTGFWSGLADAGKTVYHGIEYGLSGLDYLGSKLDPTVSEEELQEKGRLKDEHYAKMRGHGALSAVEGYSNPRIRELVMQHGEGNLRVLRDGKEQDFNLVDEEQMRSLVSGDSKISIAGGEWTTLGSTGLSEGIGGVESGKFDLTEDARKLLRLIPDDVRSQHQRNVDANLPGYNANQPPPGEGFGTGGR